VDEGIVITKYGYGQRRDRQNRDPRGGASVPDENTFSATEQAIRMVSGLYERDTVVFLLSAAAARCLNCL
jgi:hydroxypyruvate reductase